MTCHDPDNASENNKKNPAHEKGKGKEEVTGRDFEERRARFVDEEPLVPTDIPEQEEKAAGTTPHEPGSGKSLSGPAVDHLTQASLLAGVDGDSLGTDIEFDRSIYDSSDSPLRIAEIPFGKGCLGLTICPGKQGPAALGDHMWKRDLETDVAALCKWSREASLVVLTLMESDELDRCSVPAPKLQSALERAGIGWEHFPIRDLSVPPDNPPKDWPDLSGKLRGHMAAKGRVLIHCRGGLGRTGLMAALLLVDDGEASEDAIRLVRKARPHAIETREQEEYVRNYLNDRQHAGRGRNFHC